ncbi:MULTISPECIES: LysR family transcriptional regulator [Clostridium]|uniref:LysR family transcriptional regulator n=1 Tax=Clostridium TaxID=1485 RepID=UPI0004D46546|nr:MULTISPECIES: LysR family transcriptional regulator [Clostridium]KEH88910.1 LysR family transcriptional regulator [Clostridium novyi A str. BKT29909]KEH91942.1 LysR family transcriptional regulator [Clostridium novyi A str. GD211209]KEH92855.1 LysR family transcriptional regulator [Clostridium botulinum C/D str. It1]
MNLEYLQSFYMTVKCNSISKAAKALHVTQPGLSMQLQNLEKELGVSLLNRSNKGVELTEEGKVVFDYANTMLSIQGNIERDLKSLQEEQQRLIIGSCKSVGEYALPCSIYTFKKFNKKVDINLDVSNSSEVIEKLRDHSINIGIIQYDPLDETQIITKTIISDELVLVANLDNTPEEISLDEVKNLPLILREKNSGTRYLLEEELTKHDLKIEDLNVIYSLNSPEAIKSSIMSGKGFSFLPRLVVKQELKECTLKTIKIKDFKVTFDYYIAFRKNYSFTEFEKMFVDFIVSRKRGFC